jgi:hypothetical protein
MTTGNAEAMRLSKILAGGQQENRHQGPGKQLFNLLRVDQIGQMLLPMLAGSALLLLVLLV